MCYLSKEKAASNSTDGSYLFRVIYRDKGTDQAASQTVQRYFTLRNANLKAIACDDYQLESKFNNDFVKFTGSGAYIQFKPIDLTSLTQVSFVVASRLSGKLELRLDSPTGPLVSAVSIKPTLQTKKSAVASDKDAFGSRLKATLKPTAGWHDLFLVYKDQPGNKANM